MNNAEYWINKLKLEKHIEGGYFRETYRSEEIFKKETLPARYTVDHSVGTCIYFLLKSDDFSKFHRLANDEIWFFHMGAPLVIVTISPDGELQEQLLGANPELSESLHIIVPKHYWMAAYTSQKESYTLVSCTNAPGFEFSDFEMAERDALISEYPQHRQIIKKLT